MSKRVGRNTLVKGCIEHFDAKGEGRLGGCSNLAGIRGAGKAERSTCELQSRSENACLDMK